MKKTLSILLVLVMLLSLFVGCGKTEEAPAPAEKEETKTEEKAPEKEEEAEAPEASDAEKVVKVGAVYPLTGAIAAIGTNCRAAIMLAADIVNGEYDSDLLLARNAGLEGYGNAKVEVIFGDSQGEPVNGQSEAERLITQEGVCGIIGCYQSATAVTVSQACERAGVPFMCADAVANSLSESGYEYFFRSGIRDDAINYSYFNFLEELKGEGVAAETIALVYENTEWGTNAAKMQKQLAEEKGYTIVADISYAANSTDVTSEVQKLKAADPDILIQSSYVSDAILFTKTYKNLNWAPPVLLVPSGGFTTPEYLETVGEDGYYACCADVWSLELAATNPVISFVNDKLQEDYGVQLDGISARAFIGAITMFDAISRAGSDDPDAIAAALRETDIPADKLVATWGVKFNEVGDNTEAQMLFTQILDGEYKVIWPTASASTEKVLPIPEWSAR